MMRRKIRLVLLALGAIGGYGSALAGSECHEARRAAFERHVAKVCLDAARSNEAPSTP